MLNSVPVILLVGTVLGFLSGLGVGGGSLLIIWLTAVVGTDPGTARSINLLFFIPAAFVSCFMRLRKKNLSLKPLIPAIISGCIAAALFSWVSAALDMALLKKLFGIILLITGVRELFYRPRNAR